MSDNPDGDLWADHYIPAHDDAGNTGQINVWTGAGSTYPDGIVFDQDYERTVMTPEEAAQLRDALDDAITQYRKHNP